MSRHEISAGNMSFKFGRDKQSIATAYVFQNFVNACYEKSKAEVEANNAALEKKRAAIEKKYFTRQIAAYKALTEQIFDLADEMAREAEELGYEFTGIRTRTSNCYDRDKVGLAIDYNNGGGYRGDGKLFREKYLPLVTEFYETLILTDFGDLKDLGKSFLAKLSAL